MDEGIGTKTVLFDLRALRKLDREPKWTRYLREEYDVAVALKLPGELIELAKPYAAATHRSVSQQIEHWAWLGKTAEEDSELPVQFVQDTLTAVEEAKAAC